jgi:hypothetical protein
VNPQQRWSAVFGVGLAVLSLLLGIAVGRAIARKQSEQRTRDLRTRVASLHAEVRRLGRRWL